MESTIQINDIGIRVTVEDDLQTGNVEVVLHTQGERQAYLCAQLLAEDGTEADRIFPVAVEEEIDFCMRVYEVQLWNAESVCLYDLVLELRDERMQLLGSTVKKIAFRRWDLTGNVRTLNGKFLNWRPRKAPEGFPGFSERRQRAFLAETKRLHANTLLLCGDDEKDDPLRELCLRYGVYLLREDELPGGLPVSGYGEDGDAGVSPDFEFQITQQGVLLENRCVFTNASEYELRYTLLLHDTTVHEGTMCADVPVGASRYFDLPFGVLSEPGAYTYRVALCLKKDTAWAGKGTEIAFGEETIPNMFFDAGNAAGLDGEKLPDTMEETESCLTTQS